MIAESDESGRDMELSYLEIGGSESEDEENSAVVSPKPSTSRGHEQALITVGPPARPRRPAGVAGLIANDVAVTDLATDVCPELPDFTEVNGPVNTPVDATPFVSPYMTRACTCTYTLAHMYTNMHTKRVCIDMFNVVYMSYENYYL